MTVNLMPKRFIFLWTIPLFFSTSLYAQPQDASPPAERTLWDHNGSIMYLIAIGSSRELHYQKPRPGMLEAGAHPDDVLFKGEINDGQISCGASVLIHIILDHDAQIERMRRRLPNRYFKLASLTDSA